MVVLKSYLFIKDEDRTLFTREKKVRTYLVGIIIFLIGIVFLLLELIWLSCLFMLTGVIIETVGKLILAYAPNKGAIPGKLLIEDDALVIINNRYKLDEIRDLYFDLVTYEDGPSFNDFKRAEGTENQITFRLNEKLMTLNFYIPTIKHYKDLLIFLQEKGINHKANTGFPYT